MSDNSNLANSNNEPSMEDILSSIRKVIAEDLMDEATAPTEGVAEEIGEGIEEFPTSKATTSEENTSPTDDKPSTDQILTLDPLADGASETEVENTDEDDILELDSIITELPDPHTITDERGEELELVTLGDDQAADLAIEPVDDLIDGLIDNLETDQEVELEDIFLDNGPSAIPAEDATEMDLVMAANASVLAQAKINDQAKANDQLDTHNDMDFDETLDLVMDSDASDYVTTKLVSKALADTEIEALQDIATDKVDFGKADTLEADTEEADTGILELHADADEELQSALDKAVQKTLAETLAEDSLVEGILAEETLVEETLIEETMAEEPDEQMVFQQEPLQEDLAVFDLHPDIDNLEPEPTAVTPDEDMDLVKSLLDDLMDEPAPETEELVEAETVSEIDTVSLENDADITDFTNEILFREDPDHSLDDEDILIPEPPDNSGAIDLDVLEDTLVDQESDLEPEAQSTLAQSTLAQSTLAQIAKDVGKASETSPDNTPNPDDIVTLEVPDLISKLALASGVAGTAVLVTATHDEHEQDGQDQDRHEQAQATPESKPETQISQPPQPSTKEEEPMATPIRTNPLSGSDTQAEAGNAFASLTSAVQDKALAEENGPPIGELVKEALKPMLQEWLDNNLKAMVQRAVTKEIKRISSNK